MILGPESSPLVWLFLCRANDPFICITKWLLWLGFLFYNFVFHIVETFRFEADIGSLKAYITLYDLKLKPKANILLSNIS